MFTDNSHSDVDHINEFLDRFEYVNGVFGRPNFVTFANNPGRYFINGSSKVWLPEGEDGVDYLMLSDHNRAPVQFSPERIGNRKRMINGKMRSYFVADKWSIPLSWENLPSRAYSVGGYDDYSASPNSISKFTVDGGAGASELKKWYNSHPGSFWAFMSYDTGLDLANEVVFQGYSHIVEVMVTDFDFEIVGRSRGTRIGLDYYYVDTCNVNMSLEEV